MAEKPKPGLCKCGQPASPTICGSENICDRCHEIENRLFAYHNRQDCKKPGGDPDPDPDPGIQSESDQNPDWPTKPGRLGILIKGPNRNYAL